MPIDRRITNGLAWAGALLVVAIPAADVALNQFAPRATPQVAVVDPQVEPDADETVAPVLPTPAAERPARVVATTEPELEPEAGPAEAPAPAQPAEPVRDPVTTASAAPTRGSGDAVDDFISSGRPLPSYISGADAAAPVQTATTPKPAAVPKPADVAPVAPAASVPGEDETVALLPRSAVTGFPTPVSLRPASTPRAPVVTQPPLVVSRPPLVVEDDAPYYTAEDLEDWESGPLSEFLAGRQDGNTGGVTPDYDPDGFFLDQGPNSSSRVTRFPRAYDDQYYPFQ